MEKRLIKINEKEFLEVGKRWACSAATVKTVDHICSDVDQRLDYGNSCKSMLEEGIYSNAPSLANSYFLGNEKPKFNPPCPIILIEYDVIYMVIPKKEVYDLLENREKQKKETESEKFTSLPRP